jgi:antitoxin (DNA-binding transcriptional repressor) of toxin-antitoxin stability system
MDFARSTDLRRNLGAYVERLLRGEEFILMHRGKPVGEIVPFRGERNRTPAWKRRLAPLQMTGESLTATIREERDAQ